MGDNIELAFSQGIKASELDIFDTIFKNINKFNSESAISNGSITIYQSLGVEFKELVKGGTKLIDAILYVKFKDDPKKKLMFDTNSGEVPPPISLNKIDNIPAALIILFLSRGSLPGWDDKTPLPRFLKNTVDPDSETTSEFMKKIASYDMRTTDLKNIFSKPLPKVDMILQNRLCLGVAGHKPLKLVKMFKAKLKDHPEHPDRIVGDKLILTMKSKCENFYPSLHPSKQTFAQQFPNFYKNMIHLIYTYLGGNDKALELIKSTGMFRSDTFLKHDSPMNVTNFSHTWGNWSVDVFEGKFGAEWKMFEG